MPCYRPITGYRSGSGRNEESGKWPIVFNTTEGYRDKSVIIPCGKCIGCRLERSRQWAIRCMHEASLFPNNSFITLTYNKENLPSNGSLVKENFTNFMKRLRKDVAENEKGKTIRFFHAGEYGEQCITCGKSRVRCSCGYGNFRPTLGRPHHHAIIFNHAFEIEEEFQSDSGFNVYTNSKLQKLWPYGFHTVGEVSFESCAYTARYCLKKINGEKAESYYQGKEPEYTTMSRRPGIGRLWYENYKADVYNYDLMVGRDGRIMRPPKAYDKYFEREEPIKYEDLKRRRTKNANEETYERLSVMEECKELSVKQLIRNLEKNFI